jgi:membrane associated rhomboid family serine protease
MRRYPSAYVSAYSFGPGPLSTAIKAIIAVNVVLFLARGFSGALVTELGLVPFLFLEELRLWQPVTYMFLHAGLFHLLFNMLALWLIGTELERIWGTHYFVKFYFVTGIGAGLLTVLFSLLPFDFARQVYGSNVIGASGAIYGLLLAYALFSGPADIHVLPVSNTGEVLRAHTRGDCLLLVPGNDGRCGQCHAPGRPSRQLCLLERGAGSSTRGAEVPLPEVENQSRASKVRRVFRRARRRLGPAGPLTSSA